MNDALRDKEQRAGLTTTEIDQEIAQALEASRTIGEMDGRAATLILASSALFAVSLLKKGTVEVEMTGIKFEAVDWIVLVAAVAAALVYLSVNLIVHWWSERELWLLKAFPSIQASQRRLEQLAEDHRIENSNFVNNPGPGLPSFNDPELVLNRKIMAHCTVALGRLRHILRIHAYRQWSVLLFPLLFAGLALGVMGVEVGSRYRFAW